MEFNILILTQRMECQLRSEVDVLLQQSNLKAMMEFVQKGDVDKISALTNRGLDPNFIDHATGGM